MRALAVVVTGALAVGGCSLLFDGKDLHGKGGGGGDMSVGGGDDMTGGGGGGGTGGGGGAGGGGGTAACSPRTTFNFNKTTPSVAASGPYELAVADIDHDGKLDLVSANYNSNSFSVLLGDGAGGFNLAASSPVTTCTTPQLVLTGDFTGDGLPDVVISCFDNSGTPTAAVDVYVNQSTPGTVSFSPVQPIGLASQMALYYMAAGNFDGDTKLDLMLADPNSNTARPMTGNGDGSFTPASSIPSTNKGASWMVAGRLNNDAVDDVIIYNETDDDMTMLLSNGSGGFTSTRLAYNTTGTTGTLYFLSNAPTLVDVNHDGLLDILVASGTSQTGTVEKFLNSGSAAAPAFPVTPADIITGDFPAAQGLADFNCDGTLDIAVSTNGCVASDPNCPGGVAQPPNMWILPGHGTGYDAAVTIGIPVGADSLVIADFNNDGYPDIAAGASGSTI
ncbi:MAG: FG-GAP repeat domain-containing protein, partial [Polyangia bacterium]